MDAGTVILLSFIIFFVMMIFGLYIHAILMGVGILGIVMLGKTALLPGFMGYQAYPTVASYSLSTIPLFILTAQFILQAGVVQDLFTIVYNVSKGKKGMLGATTLVVGAFLGAVCGSGTATAGSLGQAAYPELVKHGYSNSLAACVSAAAGSLSSIIPPSIVIIVYGVTTETPIGKLFIAAVIPGIIVTLTYILCTFYFLRKEEKAGVQEEHIFKKKEMPKQQLVIVLSVSVVIALTIFGGIYSGFMTPTEAGAVGAFVSFVAAVLLKKVNLGFLYKAGVETVKLSSMVMLIMIGAKIFGKFISLSMMARKFLALLEPLFAYPDVILAVLILVYFFLFMFLEGTAVITMTTPILLPVMNAMGIDPLWFGIFVCVTCVVGMLTPPVGMCVYTVCGICRIPVEGAFKYGIKYAAICSLVAGGLMIAFPQIVTWLPNMM